MRKKIYIVWETRDRNNKFERIRERQRYREYWTVIKWENENERKTDMEKIRYKQSFINKEKDRNWAKRDRQTFSEWENVKDWVNRDRHREKYWQRLRELETDIDWGGKKSDRD